MVTPQTSVNISDVIDKIYTLVVNKLPLDSKKSVVMRGYDANIVHKIDFDQLDRAAVIFPVEDVAHETHEVSVLLFCRNTDGKSESRQMVFQPARMGNLTVAGLGATDRRTNNQVADIVANFIRTGDMVPQ